ncbi:NAD-dependent succinate-semialdehyde dehydrogenase [Alteraurantiacibacter aestuarii]|uniref:NAD-dependent succinate-semialdehyde dehydrogenase n=1 Tax=Alteraurantiacibacter aestuarii TaxID=650004 RepID=UPI0031DCA98B
MSTQRGALSEPDLLLSQCLIDGEWIGGEGAPIAVDDPFTGETIGTVPRLDKDHANRAIDAAARAFPGWAGRTAQDRGRVLRKWYDLIVTHKEDLARLITRENGKTLAEARGEVDYGAGFMEFYADEATRVMGETIPAPVPGRRLLAEREPVGVCAAITPWNFPLAMMTRKVGPALAAGCTVVGKPATATPLTALAFARLGEEAGVPRGVLNMLTGSAAGIGGAITASSTVRKLSFTGSTEIGEQLYRECAGTMKRLSLELGGNAPLLIFDDADLATAVETAAVAKFRNSGQSCIAANRIYVQQGIYDRFLAAFAARVQGMKAGDGFDPASDIGPLIDRAAVDKVSEHRDAALAGGGRLLAGGGDAGGLLFHPTLVADVTPDAQLACEETFGPLAGVISFGTLEQGLQLANDTPFGLAAYMCAQDPATIARVSRGLESGMVGINTGLISSPHAPFGGVKMSGLGREGSHHGLEEYLNIKYLCHAGL